VEEGIENSGRVSKHILILHKELVLKTGTVQRCKILSISSLASYRISTSGHYVTLDNKIKCLSLAIFILATPPIKL
jgi:hypothetical protein